MNHGCKVGRIYRMLDAGEVIEEGDEFVGPRDRGIKTTSCQGKIVLVAPAYRRRVYPDKENT